GREVSEEAGEDRQGRPDHDDEHQQQQRQAHVHLGQHLHALVHAGQHRAQGDDADADDQQHLADIGRGDREQVNSASDNATIA
uniref:Copper-containing nitrite reductase n=1 Tax=Steinernema glaseri TaxID=37863 RepID=A0A1I7YFY2_9BILA